MVPSPTLPTNPPHQQVHCKIPLSDLFLYPSAAEGELHSGIVFYWKGGIENLDAATTQKWQGRKWMGWLSLSQLWSSQHIT